MSAEEQLSALLLALTQPDTNTIRQAETALKPLLKDPGCVPALVAVLKSRGDKPLAVRHVAAVVLRKRLAGHYAKFDDATKTALRAEILTILGQEPERTIRSGTVGLAAVVCKLESGNWPELVQFIAGAAADAHPDARELAFMLLGENMTDTIGLHWKEHFPSLAQLFGTALLQDSAQKVQKAAVQALGHLLSYLADEPEVQTFESLMPAILQVATNCVAHHDEDTVAAILDVLYDMAACSSPTVTSHLASVVQFSLAILSSSDLEMRVRDAAALVIATLAESKPKTFGKDQALVANVLETLFGLVENSKTSAAGALFVSNPAWLEEDGAVDGGEHHISNDDDDKDDSMDSPTETSMAQGTLDMLACELPKKYFFEPCMTRCVTRLNSPHPNQRKAGIAGLGVVAEGCAEPLREHLPDVMSHVLKACGDADAQVRECACFCLGQLSEHCQPEILNYSQQVLPTVFALLDDSTVAVQATSCYVLEMFCERLEPEAVRPLLDQLVRKLATMLEMTNKRSVQEMTVAALAATAVAAEEEFKPYVAGVATLMMKFMNLQNEKLFPLRGRALECMGHMAIAVGKEAFRDYFSPTMQCACNGLTLDSTDLHEFAYAVFANLSKVMEEDFAPAVPELVPHLVQVIRTSEGQLEQAEAENNGQFNALDDSDDEDNEGGGQYFLHVRTALLEAKKGAITALGEMAAHTGPAFVPFLEESMTVLHDAADNWHPLIKAEVAEALPSMVIPSVAANHGGEVHWEKGDVNGTNPMSPHTTAVVNAVMTELVKLMTDEDQETVGKACEGIQRVIEMCGPHALAPVATECLGHTFDLLNKNGQCQKGELEYEELGLDDDDDHDKFMTSVCDLTGSFARVLGAHFMQYLPQYLPPICAFCKSSRPASDRSMAMGCLGELAQELGSHIAPHWQSVFWPAIIAGLADSDDNVKRNAAFCAGLCCESLAESVVPQYPQILQAIGPLFSVDVSVGDASAACMDNAAAAVARMIMASPASVPLGEVLPPFLKALPLKNDMTENDTVYKCLLGLLQMKNADMIAQKEEVRRVFTEACADGSRVDDEIKEKLKAAVVSL